MAKRRKKGQGTLRERADGRWEGRVVIGYDNQGMPKTKSVTAKTKAECIQRLEELKETLGVTEITKCKPDMEFGEWIEFWYVNFCRPAIRQQTKENYERTIRNQIVSNIGHYPLNQITTGLLERFYAHLKTNGRLVRREQNGDGLSNAFVRRIHALCRASLEKARIEGLIRQNPAVHCHIPPKKSPEIQVLTPDEMQRLLIQANEDGYYELFLLELSTGLRRGELIGLQWDDINLETGELKVNRQVRYRKGELEIMPLKTKASYRTIIMPSPLVEVLREYKEKVGYSKWLFPSSHKKEDLPRDPGTCRIVLEKLLKKIDCKHVPFHALRHTFATQALRYGMDVKTLASIIGHESVETTLNVYSHITDEGMKNAAKTIDRAMGAITGDYKDEGEENEQIPKPTKRTEFQAQKSEHRRKGTGSIIKINETTYQGTYKPQENGKTITHSVTAPTYEKCEQKLLALITKIKAEKNKNEGH